MVGEWTTTMFGNLCEHSAFGPRFSGEMYALDGNVATLRTTDISDDGRIEYETMPLAKLDLAKLQQHILRPGDLVITRTGRVGSTAVFDDFRLPVLPGAFLIRFRLKRNIGEPKFFHYYFMSPFGQQQVESVATGSVQKNLNITNLHRLAIRLPPLKSQKTIAHILGTLDDKIALNRRMNETLEAMARAIFKSWFVDFDPVRAKCGTGFQPVKVKGNHGQDGRATLPDLPKPIADLFPAHFADSELGPIPKGWEVGTLGDAAAINARTIQKGYPHEVIKYVDISSVTVGRLEATTAYHLDAAPSRAQRLVAHGDTIWSCVRPNRKSFLFVHQPEDNLVVSTGFAVLTPKQVPPCYLYAWATTDDFVDYLSYNADGSAYPAVRPERFAAASILLPPQPILDQFEVIVGRLRDRIAANERESFALATTRDILLPKLLSGALRVAIRGGTF
jgi:type I restriction enzyme, S subunit